MKIVIIDFIFNFVCTNLVEDILENSEDGCDSLVLLIALIVP